MQPSGKGLRNVAQMAVACPDPRLRSPYMPRQDLPWFAIRVKPKHEERTALALRQKGYEEFLPTRRERRQWADRWKEIRAPLFPGYLFCRIDIAQRLPVLTIPGVLHIVGTGKCPVPISDEEVAAIQTVTASGCWLEDWPYLDAGERIVLVDGPLKNVEGILISHAGQDRLVVSVDLLQRSVAVAVERSWIRKAPHTAVLTEAARLSRA